MRVKLCKSLIALIFFAPLICIGDEVSYWNPCPRLINRDDSKTNEKNKWDFTISAYTHHWSYSSEHKRVILIAVDKQLSDQRFCGLALFTNSFGQPSAYPYFGKKWSGLFDNPNVFIKVTAGLLYGYKEPYNDKIPFNKYGIAPAIIPSLGYQISNTDSGQVMLLGTAGILFAYGRAF